MSTSERLNEIKERLEAATPGGWKVLFADDELFSEEAPCDDPVVAAEDGQYIAQTTYDQLSNTCRPTMYADALFIAHAKEDIAWLLEQLEENKTEGM